jgi:exodeoxyribonuclease-3
MKIATYHVNGMNGRWPVLLYWLNEAAPDVVCLQKLEVPQEKFPEMANRVYLLAIGREEVSAEIMGRSL